MREVWPEYTLGQLLEMQWVTSHLDGNHGGDYPRKVEFVSEGVPYISANCIRNGSVDMSVAKYLTPERAAKLRKGIAQDRDVLFAHNATVGPVTLLRTTEPKVILGTSLTYYRCDPERILPEFLSIYMQSSPFTAQYQAVMRQSTRNQVPITKQRTFTHIIPPLPEQKRIVSILDEAFGAIAQAKENAQRNLANARELFESYLNRVFTERGEGWEEKTLGDLVEIKHGFAFKSKYFVEQSKYVVLTPGNFYEQGGFRDRGEKTKYYKGEIPSDFILSKEDGMQGRRAFWATCRG